MWPDSMGLLPINEKSDRKIKQNREKKNHISRELKQNIRKQIINISKQISNSYALSHRFIIKHFIDWHFTNGTTTRLYLNRSICTHTSHRVGNVKCHKIGRKMFDLLPVFQIITNLDKLIAFAFRLSTDDTSLLPSKSTFRMVIFSTTFFSLVVVYLF